MKFDLFYIIKHGDSDGEGTYEAGPFKSWDAAWNAKKKLEDSYKYDVYSQTIEVN